MAHYRAYFATYLNKRIIHIKRPSINSVLFRTYPRMLLWNSWYIYHFKIAMHALWITKKTITIKEKKDNKKVLKHSLIINKHITFHQLQLSFVIKYVNSLIFLTVDLTQDVQTLTQDVDYYYLIAKHVKRTADQSD